jgi:hypothetical protein
VLPESGDGAAVEGDRTPTVGYLGCAENRCVLDRDHGLPDCRAASIKVEIRPAQPNASLRRNPVVARMRSPSNAVSPAFPRGKRAAGLRSR